MTLHKTTTKISLVLLIFLFAFPHYIYAGPTSSSYELKDYGFGSGGTQSSSSTSYKAFGITGETSGDKASSTNNKTVPGLVGTLQADVPSAPTFTNPASYYNKLKVVLNTGGNPTDATYAIAISTDNFATDTKYIQSDNTIGATLGAEDWQTYAVWGGATGFNVIGLTGNTTYTIKVEAQRGNFTQTGFGPTSQASTVAQSLSFDIDVSATDSETASPYALGFGTLTINSITTATNKVWIDIDTNGAGGAEVKMQGVNNGLLSTAASHTIASYSGDLSGQSEGYGAQGNSVAQTAGGPLALASPYNGAGANVGPIDTTNRTVFNSTGVPITSGRGSIVIKAKIAGTTPSASDYADVLTITASASY